MGSAASNAQAIDFFSEIDINTATKKEVDTKYKQLAKQYHPDKSNGEREKFNALQQEYERILAAIESRQKRMPEEVESRQFQHKINEQQLYESLKGVAGFVNLEKITDEKDTRPKWGARPEKDVLVGPASELVAHKDAKKFNFTFKNKSGQEGTSTLDLTQPQQAIKVDFSNDASIESGVIMAKQAGWPGIQISEAAGKKNIDNLREYCNKHGVKLAVSPAPKAAAIADSEERAQLDDKPHNSAKA